MKINKAKLSENINGYLFILPVVAGILVFIFYPFVYSFISTFKNWNGLRALGDSPWVNTEMYLRVFKDNLFWGAFVNTLITLIGMPIGLVLSMGLAILLNRGIKGTAALRVIYYVPVVCSLTAIIILWKGLLNVDGPINGVLEAVGIKKINWLGIKSSARIGLIAMCVWKGLGASTLLYIAGLQGISDVYIEAARLDGASAGKIFWKITFPLLAPTHFFMLVTGVINGMQIYIEPRLLTNGGPAYSTRTLVMYVFTMFDARRVSEASVVAWFLGFVIFVVTAVQFAVNGRRSKR